jgi:hypothetical protein
LAVVYSEEMVVLKARSLLREQRHEAAVQLLSEAIQEHGRTRKLVDLYTEAQRELKISKQKVRDRRVCAALPRQLPHAQASPRD